MTAPLRKAMVLAAGFGKRLRPLTAYTAKPALPLMGRPLIEYILRRLARAGVCEVVVNLHHRQESVESALSQSSSELEIYRSVETEIMGTAGGLKQAAWHFGGEEVFLLLNGDTLVDFDIEGLLRAHRDANAMATLLLRPRPSGSTYSSVLVDAEGYVEWIGRARDDGELMFAGVWVLSPLVLGQLSGAPVGLERELLPRLIEERAAVGYIQDATWITIDTPRSYWAACLTMARQRLFEDDWAVSPLSGHDPAVVFGGSDTRVDKRARCQGGIVLGARCRVARSASVENVICWDDVEIPAGAKIENCVVTQGVALPSGSEFAEKLIMRVGDDTTELRRREIRGELVVTKLKKDRPRGL